MVAASADMKLEIPSVVEQTGFASLVQREEFLPNGNLLTVRQMWCAGSRLDTGGVAT